MSVVAAFIVSKNASNEVQLLQEVALVGPGFLQHVA